MESEAGNETVVTTDIRMQDLSEKLNGEPSAFPALRTPDSTVSKRFPGPASSTNQHPQLLTASLRAKSQDLMQSYYGDPGGPGQQLRGSSQEDLPSINGNATPALPATETIVLGTYRPTISQEIFDKIKEKITASREREKQSVAKQMLRKEEEKKKLARDRDADDLESKIVVLRENINLEKSKKHKIFTQLKQKMNAEETMKRQMNARERGRQNEMASHVQAQQHHSYPNATMLISQTNPSMRPRLINYQTQLNPALMQQHNPPSKRQRSPSPVSASGPGNGAVMMMAADNMAPNIQLQMQSSGGMSRNTASQQQQQQQQETHALRGQDRHSHLNPSKLNRVTPEAHLHSAQQQQQQQQQNSRISGVRSPNKHSFPLSNTHGASGGGGANSSMGTGGNLSQMPFTVASPYPGNPMGNQVVCILPNMSPGPGAAPGSHGPVGAGHPLQINPSLTQQQQQALMLQHIQALQNPEYFRAMQQMMESQQRASGGDGRQYVGIPAFLPQSVLMQRGTSVQASGGGGFPGSSQQHPHSEMQTAMPAHSSSGVPSQLENASQRVGSIMTGIPVFGPSVGNQYLVSSASINHNSGLMYPRAAPTTQ